jgi:hypothetical protein
VSGGTGGSGSTGSSGASGLSGGTGASGGYRRFGGVGRNRIFWNNWFEWIDRVFWIIWYIWVDGIFWRNRCWWNNWFFRQGRAELLEHQEQVERQEDRRNLPMPVKDLVVLKDGVFMQVNVRWSFVKQLPVVVK